MGDSTLNEPISVILIRQFVVVIFNSESYTLDPEPSNLLRLQRYRKPSRYLTALQSRVSSA